jgi:hypothetical protein
MKPNHANKYGSEQCTNKMTFQECELAILRHAVDQNEKLRGEKIVSGSEITKMVQLVEDFLINKKLLCYGGTAINNILPKSAQFYDRSIEIPDYDFFSANALDDAKELSDIFYKAGYLDVEAKSGVHHGTYKVFVNFIPMADITSINKELFESLSKESIKVAGIRYVPANFLRMSMYLELSRPEGDLTRWEKVLKRLTLLNTYHPLKVDYDCNQVDFQRKMDTRSEDSEKIYITVRDTLIEMGAIFFGGYASSLYSRYMPKENKHLVKAIPDFDVLFEDPAKCALIVEERLNDEGFKDVKTVKHEAVGEVIPEHIEIRLGKEVLAFVYKPIACHNYNVIKIGDREVNVATIDTILSFYLAFLYADAPYYYKDRIVCMAKFLFEVEQRNRLTQRGLLKRFTSTCYGKQETMESVRAEKAVKFAELRKQRDSREFEEWFLKYVPVQKYGTPKSTVKDKILRKSESVKETGKGKEIEITEEPQPDLVQEPTSSEVSPKQKSVKSKAKKRKTRKNKFGIKPPTLFLPSNGIF